MLGTLGPDQARGTDRGRRDGAPASVPRTWITLAVAALVLVPAGAPAQEVEGEAPAAASGPPRREGRTEASGAVGQEGMTFEIRSGARLVIPPRLPIGSSRLLTFGEARERPPNSEVAPGFTRIGPVLRFDGAINATREPIVVSIRQPRDPSNARLRAVIAVEQAGFCAEGLRPLGTSGLCSVWSLVDARWEDGRLLADLHTPGGQRLVFGTVPRPAEGSE